ncbi:MAG: YibE/F family protein [Halanaerobiales bacterium]
MIDDQKKYKNTAIALIICLFMLLTISIPLGSQPAEEYYRGIVISVSSEEGEGHLYDSIEQIAEVEITTGPYKDKTVTINNLYVENREHLNIILEEGMRVIVGVDHLEEGAEFFLQDVSRDRGLLYLVLGFVILLLLVGRFKGLKTLISLLFTGLVIVKVMFPLLLQGYSPIIVAVLSAIVIIVFIFLVIGGFNHKSLAAIIGTSVGVIVAGILAYILGEISYLTGFSTGEAQILLSGDFNIDIRGLLFAGIIIGSLGAITDVAMSIASTTVEIIEANPLISSRDLMISSFNVGRDIMGTMSNTLILAYVGGSMHLLLALMRFEISWLRIINTDMIATEVVRGLAGSIGLIVSIPVTALVAAEFMAKR